MSPVHHPGRAVVFEWKFSSWHSSITWFAACKDPPQNTQLFDAIIFNLCCSSILDHISVASLVLVLDAVASDVFAWQSGDIQFNIPPNSALAKESLPFSEESNHINMYSFFATEPASFFENIKESLCAQSRRSRKKARAACSARF